MNAKLLLNLAEAFCISKGLTMSTFGVYALNRGSFFTRIKDKKTCTLNNADRAIRWFSANWPSDLPWPAGITRPELDAEELKSLKRVGKREIARQRRAENPGKTVVKLQPDQCVLTIPDEILALARETGRDPRVLYEQYLELALEEAAAAGA